MRGPVEIFLQWFAGIGAGSGDRVLFTHRGTLRRMSRLKLVARSSQGRIARLEIFVWLGHDGHAVLPRNNNVLVAKRRRLTRALPSINNSGIIIAPGSHDPRAAAHAWTPCACRKLTLVYIGGAVRPKLARPTCDRRSGRRGGSVHPCSVTSVCELRCNIFDMI